MKFDEGGLRPDKMTPRERIRALVQGKPIDRVPFIPFMLTFVAKNAGISNKEYFMDPEKSYQARKWTVQQYGIDAGASAYGNPSYGAWEFGGEARPPESKLEQGIIVTRYPVQTEEQGWNLKLPDVKTAGYLPIQMEFSKIDLKYRGSAPCPGMGPFCTAVNLTGPELFCRWLISKPKLCHHLLRLTTEHRLQVVQHWVETFGVDRVRIQQGHGPEANTLISPKQFEEFVFPYTKELHERILAMGIKMIFAHLCGEQNKNLPYWKQIPFGEPGMLSIGHEVDITTAIEYLGEKNIIFGNVNPMLILMGPPERIYEECRKCIEKGKKVPRGYVLMSGCEIPTETPSYNVWVMRKAVSDFGFYE